MTGPGLGAPGFREWGALLSNWGRWGPDDTLGTLNLITPERRAAAARLVTSGVCVPLGLEFNSRGPQPSGGLRPNPVHMMTRMGTPGRHSRGFEFADDLVLLPTQCATQIDALAHVSYDGEIYNGHRFETVGADGAKVLGVERFRTGIQGRGVLLDFPRLFGMDRLEGGRCITVRDMEACLKAQSVRAGEGDILLLRTGWIQLFLDHGDRDAYMASEPGIGLEVTEWLHRNGIAFVASDTFGVEVVPEEGRGEVMPVHCVLVRDMGMPLGEMFDLEAVAAQCERSGRWEFLFSCLPLPITGGVGSPVAPIATF